MLRWRELSAVDGQGFESGQLPHTAADLAGTVHAQFADGGKALQGIEIDVFDVVEEELLDEVWFGDAGGILAAGQQFVVVAEFERFGLGFQERDVGVVLVTASLRAVTTSRIISVAEGAT